MTGSDLVDTLRVGCAEVVTFFEGLDPEPLTLDITASEHPEGRPWSAKDHLAHLVQREKDFLSIARRLIGNEPNPLDLEHRGSTSEERSSFVNRENQQAIHDRENQSMRELVSEFVALRSELKSLVRSLAPADADREVEIGPNRAVPVGVLLLSSDRHAKAHLEIIHLALDSTAHSDP